MKESNCDVNSEKEGYKANKNNKNPISNTNNYQNNNNYHDYYRNIQIDDDLSHSNNSQNNIRDFNKIIFNNTEEKERYESNDQKNREIIYKFSKEKKNDIKLENSSIKDPWKYEIKEDQSKESLNNEDDKQFFEKYNLNNSNLNLHSNNYPRNIIYSTNLNNEIKKSQSNDNLKNIYKIQEKSSKQNYNKFESQGVYETINSELNTQADTIPSSNQRLIHKYKTDEKRNAFKTKINSKKLNRSLPSLQNDKFKIHRNEFDYEYFNFNVQNKSIKIPNCYLNESVKKNSINLNRSESEDIKSRIWSILQTLYSLIEETKLDPIINTFKNNEILQKFFIQRIYELIAEVFYSEKEIYIQNLLLEKKEFHKSLKQNENKYEELNSKLNILEESLRISKLKQEESTKSFNFREEELLKALNEKELKIGHLINLLDQQEKESKDLFNKFSELHNNSENLKNIYNRVSNENSNLKSKIKFLETENNSSSKKYNDLEIINRKYEEENYNILKQLNEYRERYEILNSEDAKNQLEMNKLIEENFSLKVRMEDKLKFIDEIMSEFEAHKKTNDEKIKNYEFELERLTKMLSDMEEAVNNTYKLKNAALKNKLKEKVDLIDKQNEDFSKYKKEKEILIQKMLENHQAIMDEKNRIIEDLMKKNKMMSY